MNASSYLLCNSKTSVVGIFTSPQSLKVDQVLVTEQSAVYVFDSDERKCSSIWTMSPSVQNAPLTATSIRDPLSKSFFAVQSKHTILTWKVDYEGDLDKVNKKKFASNVHSLLSNLRLQAQILVVFDNGQVSLIKEDLTEIATNKDNIINQNTSSVRWTNLYVHQESNKVFRVYLAVLQQLKEKNTLHYYSITVVKDTCKIEHVTSFILQNTSEKAFPMSVDFHPVNNELAIFWNDGTLEVFEVLPALSKMTKKFSHIVNTYKLPVGNKTNTVKVLSYRETLTMLVGQNKNDKKYTITLWNNNFGTIEGTHELTVLEDSLQQYSIIELAKILGDNGVLVGLTQHVAMVSVYAHRGTLASALGSMGKTNQFIDESSVPRPLHLDVPDFNSFLASVDSTKSEQLAATKAYIAVNEGEWKSNAMEEFSQEAILDQLCDKIQTPLQSQFNKLWNTLMTNNEEEEIFLSDFAVRKILERVLEDKYWNILETLITSGLVSANSAENLIDVLLKENQHELLVISLRNIKDLTSVDLVKIIRQFIVNVKEEKITIEIFEKILKAVFKYPVTELYMINAVKHLTLQESNVVLKYVHKWIKEFVEESETQLEPTLSELSMWADIILDSHFVDLALNKDNHKELYEFQSSLNSQIRISEKITDLAGILTMFQEKQELPKRPDAFKVYTVEALVL